MNKLLCTEHTIKMKFRKRIGKWKKQQEKLAHTQD